MQMATAASVTADSQGGWDIPHPFSNAAAQVRRRTVMVMSNSPHPVSVTSYGGRVHTRCACAKLGCRPKVTLAGQGGKGGSC